MGKQDSTKPVGTWEVRRCIKVPALRHAADEVGITHALESVAGVRKAEVAAEKHRVVVRYDASETDYRTIVDVLEEVGYPPSNHWWSNMKANWYQFSDINARDNAHAPPAACCNKPPRQRKP